MFIIFTDLFVRIYFARTCLLIGLFSQTPKRVFWLLRISSEEQFLSHLLTNSFQSFQAQLSTCDVGTRSCSYLAITRVLWVRFLRSMLLTITAVNTYTSRSRHWQRHKFNCIFTPLDGTAGMIYGCKMVCNIAVMTVRCLRLWVTAVTIFKLSSTGFISPSLCSYIRK